MEEISLQVHAMMVEKLGIDENKITDESDFRKDLNIDSLDLYELFLETEKQFAISIPDEIAEKIETVGQLIVFISSQRN
jgi:acyl carrier protein